MIALSDHVTIWLEPNILESSINTWVKKVIVLGGFMIFLQSVYFFSINWSNVRIVKINLRALLFTLYGNLYLGAWSGSKLMP